jgi:ATP-dependent DNA helicase RecQ
MASHEPPVFDWTQALERLGYERFRPGQLEAIQTLLDQGRLLLVAPTGGGKSLTYQLPATLLRGTTLVVSPLISLMNDQVTALQARDVPATYLASTLPAEEARRRMAAARRGEYKLVYVAPERLAFPGFRAMAEELDCPLVVIDEAHCITEWGHDFRPEYLQIRHVLRALPRARVLACTATATPVVRDEILAQLGLDAETPQLVRGFARPNLALRAQETNSGRERQAATDACLAEVLGTPGSRPGCAIVYAPTRKKAESEAERLSKRGWRAAAYHAGLSSEARERAQSRFTRGELQVVVATNAFGMGIDRADVRAVVHLAPPGSMEAYYQEVGRAGRDGEPAIGLLLSSPPDMALRRRLLESPSDGLLPDPAVVEHKWNLFLELMRWTEGGSCRHDAILRYFGTEDIAHGGCGRCDVCTSLGETPESDDADTQLLVRKALSGVARVHDRFGLVMAAKLLRGQTDPKLVSAGYDGVSTFGVLRDHSEDWIVRLLRRCVTAGWVSFSGSERPTLLLTREGARVMKGQLPARLVLPPTSLQNRAPTNTVKSPRAAAELDAQDLQLFEALRAHRLEVARDEKVPPYVVASDRTLRDLARQRPTREESLLLVHGIGPGKAERYGAGLLRIVRSFKRH